MGETVACRQELAMLYHFATEEGTELTGDKRLYVHLLSKSQWSTILLYH